MINKKYMAIAAWLVATVFYGGVGGSHIVPQLAELYALSKSNQTATAEIIETYPQMHSTCKYRFPVGNRVYENTGRSCGGASIGEKILIYYSTTHPDNSVNGNPESLFMNDLIPFVLALVLFPALAAFVTYKRLP